MAIELTRLDPIGVDRDELIAFVIGNEFPFHVIRHPTRRQVENWIAAGAYRSDDNDTYWIAHSEHGRIGIVRFEEITDDAPLFDLRLGVPFRRRGLGADALRMAADHVFTTMDSVNRFEGQTREDNTAMRRTFEKCGWVQEAHYRDGWPVDGSSPLASVAYGILRRDWASGTVTPISWGIPG